MRKLIYSLLLLTVLFSCKKDNEPATEIKNCFVLKGFIVETPLNKDLPQTTEHYALTHGVINKYYDEVKKKYYWGILLLSSGAVITETENGAKIETSGAWNGVCLNGFITDVDYISDGTYSFLCNRRPDLKSEITSAPIEARAMTDDGSGFSWWIDSCRVNINKSNDNYVIDFKGIPTTGGRKEILGNYEGNLKMRNTISKTLSFYNMEDYKN